LCLPGVDLIREPSQGVVLSDVAAGAAGGTGDLLRPLADEGEHDRDAAGAFRWLQQSTPRRDGEEFTEEFTAVAELLTGVRAWRALGRRARL